MNVTDKGRAQLQEVYNHLDSINGGDQRMAYYGQLRAQEHSHEDALMLTIKYFNLTNKDWYLNRMARAGK